MRSRAHAARPCVPAPGLQTPAAGTASTAAKKCCILDSSGSLRSWGLVLLREPNLKYRTSAANLIWTSVVDNLQRVVNPLARPIDNRPAGLQPAPHVLYTAAH